MGKNLLNTEFLFKAGLSIWLGLLASCSKNYRESTYRPIMADYDKALSMVFAMPREQLNPEVLSLISKHEIYYSLTVTPKRLSSELPYVLRSLLADSGIENVPRKIFIAIPTLYKNKPEGVYDESKIAELERLDPRIQIIRGYDYGPASKLIPAVDFLKENSLWGQPNQIVVTFDDDTLYSVGHTTQLIKHAVLSDNTVAVGASGHNAGFWKINNFPTLEQHRAVRETDSVSSCDILEGFRAIAYPVHLLDSNLVKKIVAHSSEYCRVSDDLVLSFVLVRKNVPRLLVNNQYTVRGLIQLQGGFQKDALHVQTDNELKYQNCFRQILGG